MRPLYLDVQEPTDVTLDGPALRVSTVRCCARHFPVARVSRVVVTGPVSWSTEALLACADEGITITFLTRGGRLRGRWLGSTSRRSEFEQRCCDFTDRPDRADLHQRWRTDFRRHVIRMAYWRLGLRPRAQPAARVLALAEIDAAQFLPWKRKLYALAYARALDELAKAGLGRDTEVLDMLARDLTTAIQWGLHPDLVSWVRDGNGTAPKNGVDEVVEFFEAHRDTVDFHVCYVMRAFARFLRETE